MNAFIRSSNGYFVTVSPVVINNKTAACTSKLLNSKSTKRTPVTAQIDFAASSRIQIGNARSSCKPPSCTVRNSKLNNSVIIQTCAAVKNRAGSIQVNIDHPFNITFNVTENNNLISTGCWTLIDSYNTFSAGIAVARGRDSRTSCRIDVYSFLEIDRAIFSNRAIIKISADTVNVACTGRSYYGSIFKNYLAAI